MAAGAGLRSRWRVLIGVAVAFAALTLASPSFAGSFQVNSNEDSATPTPDCKVLNQTGTCTLRDAIGLANVAAGPNTIGFNIGGGGSQTITLTSALPTIDKTTTIDGTSQPAYAGAPLIAIDGISFTAGPALSFTASGGGVKALNIRNFSTGAAISLAGGGASVTASYIGTDSSGTSAAYNATGISIGSANNTIGGTTAAVRNVISSNLTAIEVSGASATGNTIEGNFVGLDSSGSATLFGSEGILLDGGSSTTTVGGTAAGTANVIAGVNDAVALGDTHNDVVKGNLIGTDASGSTSLGNDIGVNMSGGAHDNTIGSVGAGANVIVGSNDVGVLLIGGATSNTVDGNQIGLDSNGLPSGGSNDEGVRILDSGSTANTVSHNLIRLNNLQGIELDAGPNTILANTITGNDEQGITVASGVTGGKITQNSIDNNSALGIDLASGANNDQAAPTLTSSVGSGSTIQIQGSLSSAADTDYVVEFFRSPACDPSGAGEGATYLASSTEHTDSGGTASFNLSVPAAGNGSSITATATDPAGNTSEFSTCSLMSGDAASTYVVNSSDDHDDGTCGTDDCTLREAINSANAASGQDTINFGIEPNGQHTITPNTDLPTITGPLTIDGTTQNGPNVHNIEVDGELTVSAQNGGLQLTSSAGGSTIRGLVINRFWTGIDVQAGANGVTIVGNLIGTDPLGADGEGNANDGIHVEANNATIGGTTAADRNVIAGNQTAEIDLENGATGNVIKGNYIGTTASGDAQISNSGGEVIGVDMVSVNGNTVGGSAAGAGNVISGVFEGIDLNSSSSNNTIQGNKIGTNAAGTAAVPNSSDGIYVYGAGPNVITGNLISGNGENGINLQQLTANPSVSVTNNMIGTNAAGTAALGNSLAGVHVNDGVGITLSGNTVSGNAGNGITIFGFGSSHNLISQNKIGTNAAGDAAIPNSNIGVLLDESNPNTIDSNVISGNGSDGVTISGPAADDLANVVTGNTIGLNAAGTAALANHGDGVRVFTDANTIGGATTAARNVVSGNTGHGIELFSADSNTVQGNYTGTNTAGTAAIPNGIDGIGVDGGSYNTITGNLASGNTNQGISIFQVVASTAAVGNTVQGNKAGLNAAGTGFVPNGGDGLRVFHATNTTFGGIGAGQANESAGNGANGIAIIGANSTGNTARGNRVHDNGKLGIELTAGDNFDGLTANDPGDGDTGANKLQNFPVLTSATVNGSSTRIVGTLSTSPGTYTIDFYASPSCDASGNGEGASWIGYAVQGTDASGSLSIDTGTGITATVHVGDSITATATDSNGNTSEFSTCVTAGGPIAGLSLTSDEASAPAGGPNVPLGSVPPSLLGLFAAAPIPNSPIPNSAVGAAPIPNSPIPNSPIPNSPIPNSPIPNSPIANSGFDGIPQSLLNNVPLSSIPIDWSTVFVAPDVKAGVPVASLTLFDLFQDAPALARFEQLKLGQLQLQNSILRGVRFASFLFGATKLKYIPPYTQSLWCGQLASCNQVDVNTTTVLGLDVGGLLDPTTLARLGQVTVGDITDPGPPVTPIPNSPIPNSPIPNSPIPNSPIPNSSLSLTAIGAIVIGNLYRPDNVVDCTKFSSRSVCLASKLSDAASLGAIKATATFEDLLAPQDGVHPSTSPLWRMNFNAFAVGLIGIENLPWESWPFDGFQQFVATTSVVHYHLMAPVVQCGVPYQLRVLLPHGFVVKSGSSALALAIGGPSPVADPVSDPQQGATWSLPPIACSDVDSVRLDFQGLPGFRLGKQTSTASLIIGSSVNTALEQAPVTVTQSNEPTDDSSATAPAIQANNLAIGHIATSGDVDWRSLSTTGLPRGTVVTAYLRPPTSTDLDLYLTKPSQQSLLSSPIPNSPIPNSPIPNSPLPDLGGTLNGTASNPQPEGLQDAPIPNSQIASSGITRGDGLEVAQVVLGGDENGPVNIAVTGYNGAHSLDAYTLRVKVAIPPQLPACPARTYAFPNVSTTGALPKSIPSTTQTLFVMNFNALAKTYGSTAANNLLTKLNAVAGRTEVKGVVLQVDGDSTVRSSKAAWDAAPCSTAARNDVVRKTNAVIARYRAQATGVQNIVIVGGDEIQPMADISDLTTDANESTAVGDLAFTTNGLTKANALFASEFLSNVLTDDAYTAGTTIPWFGRELYLPQLAGGRLVETPDEIIGQLQQYIDSNGVLAPNTAVVTGYDFMKDEAGQIATDIQSRTPSVTVDTSSGTNRPPFIGDQWSQSDIQPYYQTQSRSILSVNGHYNHWELAPAQPSPPTTSGLVSTAVLPTLGSSTLEDKGSILFTMGCHAGLNVSDAFPRDSSTIGRLRDWAQALSQNRVAVYVANTGYGYGDTDTIALSERLMTMFSHNLVSDGSIGRKLVLAKQQYFATIASYDPYAEKALAEATFYGLPFYSVGTRTEPSGPPGVTPVTDTTGNTAAKIVPFTYNTGVGGNLGLTEQNTGRGTFWSGRDGVEYLKDRPIEPRVTDDATATDGSRAHGVRITELTTRDMSVNPEIATPTIDLSAHEPEANVSNVIFPATFASINHWSAFGANHDQLVVVPGQTRLTDTGGQSQRLVDHIKVEVLYSTSTDVTPPIFGTVGSIVNGSTATLFAHTSDAGSGVVRVVAYFTQGGAQWTFVTLTRVGTTDLYTATVNGITVPKIEAAFSSQDAAGNVAYTTDKGKLFTSLTADHQAPEVLISSPAEGANYLLGSSVPARYSCSDDGGISTCSGDVANGVNIITSPIGPKTFSVNATDLSGNSTTVTVHYNVIWNFDSGSGGFLSPIVNPPGFNTGTSAGSTVPIKFTLGGNQGLNIFDPGPPQSPYSQPMSCDPSVPLNPTATTNTAGGSTLTYDSKTQTYTYNWKTDPSWTGTCRLLTVKFRDGTTHIAFFKFK
jgi:CSLREA domain-containing protein